MRSPRQRLIRRLLILTLLTLPTVASAQSAREEQNQQVIFDDDLLDAALSTPFGDPLFAGHLPPARTLLIRPRTNFVAELYKSIEQI
ncbi:MAG TPA: hypothetical protein VF294_06615 [Polyangiaceae bacterium]